MARKSISVTHEDKLVKFPEFSSDDPLVYELFSKLSSDEYEDSFNAMLHIGAFPPQTIFCLEQMLVAKM